MSCKQSITVTAQFTTTDQALSQSDKSVFRIREPTFLPKLKKDLLVELNAMLDSHEVSKARDLNVHRGG